MSQLLSITLFVLCGAAFVGLNLLLGSLVRPRYKHPAKSAPYECGEIPQGSAWVQFDLRFYIVALVYLVFAVEVVLFYPWAVAYGNAEQMGDPFVIRGAALVDMLVFFGILMLGFAYLWRFGYLDWIRPTTKKN